MFRLFRTSLIQKGLLLVPILTPLSRVADYEINELNEKRVAA